MDMSIEAIRERSRKAREEFPLLSMSEKSAVQSLDDIDFLLAEIDRLNEEVDDLRYELDGP